LVGGFLLVKTNYNKTRGDFFMKPKQKRLWVKAQEEKANTTKKQTEEKAKTETKSKSKPAADRKRKTRAKKEDK